MNVAELLAGKRVCVCGGAGGVGKTTTSAAIALGMARQGARVAVVTIDPAKRLANALGLTELGNEPRRVEAGIELEGELWAMMLDPKRTFDELIDRLADDPARAAEIKANRIYGEISSAVAGSQEYTAMAKLHELTQEDAYDLIVLDTPPSRNAQDFLDAPGRLSSFLDGRALRLLVRPSNAGMRLIGRGTGVLLGGLKRLSGSELVGDLTTFFTLLGGMTEDFSRRAHEVEQLLRADTTAFLLVTSAQPGPIEEALWFRRSLRRAGLPFSGVVVNRFRHDPLGTRDPAETVGAVAAAVGPELGLRVSENLRDIHVLARRDAAGVARLEAELRGEAMILVPALDDDVHDLDGLLAVQEWLFADDADRPGMLADLVA